MATAEELRQEFTDYMDMKGLKYTVMDKEDNMVYLAFGGEKETFVMVDFDESGDDSDSVHFNSIGFAKAAKADFAKALVKINDINRKYRWVKTFILEDGKICCDADANVYPGTVGQECVQVVIRMSNIIEDILGDLEGVAEIDEEAKKTFDMLAMFKRFTS